MSQLALHPIRVLVLGDSLDALDAVESMLSQEPGIIVTTSGARFGEGIRAVHQSEPDVVLLLADSLVGADPLIAVEELGTARPWTGVVVLSSCGRHTSRDFVLSGARDCLSPPYERDTLVESLRQVHAHETRRRERLAARIEAGDRSRSCQLVAVHGAKGGVGTTTIAVNLAVALKMLTEARVALLDANLQFGDVGVALNVSVATTIVDLLSHLQDLDSDLLNRVMVAHSSGVKVLSGPSELEDAESVSSDQMRRILSALTGDFDYVVADTAATLDSVGLSVLDQAHKIVLVTTPEIPALKNTGRFLQVSRRLGYPPEKTLLVVNRAESRDSVSLSEIEKSLGLKPAATIPSAGGVFVRAVNRGEDVVAIRTAKGISDGIQTLARQLIVSSDSDGGSQRNGGGGGLFKRWRRQR